MLTYLIPAILAGLFGTGLLIGLFTARSEDEAQDAADTYRAIVHRNAISEPIPFASSVAPVNAPGLVEVHPRAHQAPGPSPHQSAAPTTAPIQTALPVPPSVTKPADLSVSAASEKLELPLQLAEQPTEAEAEVVIESWEAGTSMTKTILHVWGIKAGGGKRYKAARERYKHYLAEVTHHA